MIWDCHMEVIYIFTYGINKWRWSAMEILLKIDTKGLKVEELNHNNTLNLIAKFDALYTNTA